MSLIILSIFTTNKIEQNILFVSISNIIIYKYTIFYLIEQSALT